MPVTTATLSGALVLERGPLRVEIAAAPVRHPRAPRRPAADPRARRVGARGRGRRPVHPVHRGRHRRARRSSCPSASSPRASPSRSPTASRSRVRFDGGRAGRLRVTLPADARRCSSSSRSTARRCASRPSGTRAPSEHFAGLGARHALRVDHAGRADPARRRPRLHRARTARRTCSPIGGVPQGDYAPAPWLQSSRGYAVWADGHGNGMRFELGDDKTVVSARAARRPAAAAALHRPVARRAAAALPARDRACRAVLPEWGYGFWKSRDVYPHQDDVEDDVHGCRGTAIPLDAVVLDSPWETQYNTWEPNPHQFPDFAGMVRAFRATRRADGRVGDAVGEPRVRRRPDAARPRVARAARGAGVELRGGRERRALRPRRPTASRSSRAGGWGRARRSTSPRPPPRRGGARRPSGALRLGVEGIKADDGEGYYFPDDVRFADGSTGASAAWAHGGAYRALDAARARRGPARPRRAVRPLRLERPAGDRDALGRRPGVGLLVAAGARRRDAVGRRERLLELVARRRRLPRPPARRALPGGAARALGAARLLHAAHAGARPARAGAVDLRRRARSRIYRSYVLLHERLVPYIRAAAATAARCGPADHPPAAPRRPAATSAAGRSPTRSASARRCGSRRCSTRARARARSRCRAATGSRRGRASACAAAARSSPRRRASRSRSGCARARSS